MTKIRVTIKPVDLPPREMMDPTKVTAKWWTHHCHVAEGLPRPDFKIKGGDLGVRKDMIGVHYQGRYVLFPTPPWMQKIIQKADDYVTGKTRVSHVVGATGYIDTDTFVYPVSAVPQPKATPKGNTPAKKAVNRAYSKRVRKNVYSRQTG